MLKNALAGLCGTCVWLLLGSTPAHGAGPDDVVLYASDVMTVQGNWAKASSTTGAGGQYMSSTDNGWSTAVSPLASPAHFFEADITVTAGTLYQVWLRIRAASDTKWNESVWVQFSDATDPDGVPIYRIGSASALLVNLENCNGCGVSGWGWQDGAYWLNQSGVKFPTTGTHKVRVQTREDGVQIDQIVLSPSTYFSAAPGQVTGDSTIVSKPVATVASSTPFYGTPAIIPGTIEAEDFDKGVEGAAYHDDQTGNTGGAYRQTGVDLETASDGRYNVGWIAAGEWLNYTVNVMAAGTYSAAFRVASSGQGGTFHLEMNGTNVSGPITVPNTGGWQTWTTVSKPVTLSAGQQKARIVMDSAGPGGAIGNLNWMQLLATAPPPSSGSDPYSGAPALIPGTIEAEHFDYGAEGVAYHDTGSTNAGGLFRQTGVDIEVASEGGFDVGWTADGEWLNYSVNVVSSGTHTVHLRVGTAVGGMLHVGFSGSGVWKAVPVGVTGGWQTWTTVSFTTTLTAGPQLLTVSFDTGGVNLNRIQVTSAVPTPLPTGPTTRQVPAGGDFQAVLNFAQPGDTIVLQAGVTYTGNFVLPAKSGDAFITIRSSAADSVLPGPTTRITPAYADRLPKIKSIKNEPPLRTAPGAHHYRLMFLEFPPTYQGQYDIIRLGDGSSAQNTLGAVPYEIILDRVYVYGDPVYGQKRAISLNSRSTTIANSYIADIKAVGQDSQAIGGVNGPGPYTIVNNYLEAAGENIMFGGSDPAIPNLVPSDIVIRRNHLVKRLAWRTEPWTVKNLFELKNAQRVTVDGNIMENNWVAAQSGYAILFSVRNQDGGCPWCVVQDVQFTNNVVRNVASAINILGRDYNYPSLETNRVVVRNNLFENVNGSQFGGPGRLLVMTEGGRDITFDHNTVLQNGLSVISVGNPVQNFVFTNNIVPDYSWAIVGDNMNPGNKTIAAYFPYSRFLGNIFAGSNPANYPAGNHYPASLATVGFVNYLPMLGGNYRLAVTSLYRNAGNDGKDVGVDFDALNAAAGTAY